MEKADRKLLDNACNEADLEAVQGILAKYPKGHAPLLNDLNEVRTMGRERERWQRIGEVGLNSSYWVGRWYSCSLDSRLDLGS